MVIKIVRISAVWCPACLIMHSRYEEVKKLFPNFEYIDYDYDLDEEIIEQYNVGTTLPVLVILDNDKEINRIVGEKTVGQISEVLKGYTILILFSFIPFVQGEKLNVYLFYSDVCSTCKEEMEFLEEYSKENDFNIVTYETTRNKENDALLSKVRQALNNNDKTVPYTVIGTTGMTGFNETVENQIKIAIAKYKEEEYVDIVDVVINDLDVDYTINPPEGNFNIPLLGDVDPKDVSLPLVAIILGFIDGFNPCAMWVLLFLLSIIITMKDRKKMWVIGLTFLTTSALVYLAFMLAWLSVAITLSQIFWVRFIIAIIALLGGAINLTSYYKERKQADGCQVVDKEKRKSILKRINKVIKQMDDKKTYLLAILGVMGLAVTVNLIELACSSGLPLIFTQILALNDLNSLQYLIYILIYIILFLIDDIVIFVIAMKTLKLTGISTKYSKLSHLIGGILMLLIGILMIFKPEWLMFNF